ncbi:hypothetical protein VB715_18565 [Crocosphaera sp. UHCC 0190]|uniref:hypothetical protein n=1 Tax=Crocosphaera sp. UHCC 0190 TaxID=3110246 RepID=UPI002B1EA7F9|nr:hypothetical protein [Crocosphaera sp. UHCC 0190]MEA5511779.1 hypothetical protein [Crocosphaera sp. UHCC 0190]
MNHYPFILIPEVLQAQREHIPQAIKPTYPNRPKPPPPLPPEPQPLNVPAFLVGGGIGLGISILSGILFSLFNSGLGAALMSFGLLLTLILMGINSYIQIKSFPKRKQAHEQLQQRYLLRLERYGSNLAEFDRKQANYGTALREYGEALKLWEQQVKVNPNELQSILTNLRTYQGINSQAKRGHSEARFEGYLKQYFGNKIKIGVWLQNTDYDKGFHYTPDFAYIDEETNLHIDIEIDEPYGYKRRQPLHYLNLEKEIIRDYFFLDCLWIVIRFSEEQVVKYPQSSCKEIAKIINEVTGNDSILSRFLEVENIEPIERWTYEEALEMASQDYRKGYL